MDRLVWPINRELRDPNNPKVRARRQWWSGRMDEGIARKMRWRLRLWTRRKGRWYGHGGPVGKSRHGGGAVEDLAQLRQLSEDGLEEVVWGREVDEETKGDGEELLADDETDYVCADGDAVAYAPADAPPLPAATVPIRRVLSNKSGHLLFHAQPPEADPVPEKGHQLPGEICELTAGGVADRHQTARDAEDASAHGDGDLISYSPDSVPLEAAAAEESVMGPLSLLTQQALEVVPPEKGMSLPQEPNELAAGTIAGRAASRLRYRRRFYARRR